MISNTQMVEYEGRMYAVDLCKEETRKNADWYVTMIEPSSNITGADWDKVYSIAINQQWAEDNSKQKGYNMNNSRKIIRMMSQQKFNKDVVENSPHMRAINDAIDRCIEIVNTDWEFEDFKEIINEMVMSWNCYTTKWTGKYCEIYNSEGKKVGAMDYAMGERSE